jgi:hypothetical protein
MPSLLSPEDLAAVKEALKDLVDTFFKKQVIIRHRVNVTTQQYGEKPQSADSYHPILGLFQFTRSSGGKYHTLYDRENGMTQEDGWRFYLWADDVEALGITVNPEADKIVMDDFEYVIKFWAPSALFSDLGCLLYELEILYDTRQVTNLKWFGQSFSVSRSRGALT